MSGQKCKYLKNKNSFQDETFGGFSLKQIKTFLGKQEPNFNKLVLITHWMRPLLTEETAFHNYSKRFSFQETSQNLKENRSAIALYCVKTVPLWSYSGPHFPAFGPK